MRKKPGEEPDSKGNLVWVTLESGIINRFPFITVYYIVNLSLVVRQPSKTRGEIFLRKKILIRETIIIYIYLVDITM